MHPSVSRRLPGRIRRLLERRTYLPGAVIGHERGEGAERQGALHHAPATVEEDGRGPRTDHEREDG